MKIERPEFNLEVVKRFLHLPDARPNRVQVEITNRCNLNCSMCPRDDYGLPEKDMPFSFFREIMSRLEGVDLILPVGWGESFFHPEFDKIVDHLKERGHTVKVTTNGLLLKDKRLFETALKIDYLSFSLDEMGGSGKGHTNAPVVESIRRLVDARNKRGLNRPFIALQPVLFKGNKDILDIIRLASELGADRVNIVRPYTKFDKTLSPSWDERVKVYEDAEVLGKRLGVRVDAFEYATFTGLKRFLWKHFKWIFRVNSWCPRLYDFAYVTLDGKVTPCCALPRYVVGDLMEQSLGEIWRGEKMNEFRKNHKVICAECEVLKVK